MQKNRKQVGSKLLLTEEQEKGQGTIYARNRMNRKFETWHGILNGSWIWNEYEWHKLMTGEWATGQKGQKARMLKERF